MNSVSHIPVLLRPVLEYLQVGRGTFIDGTFGAGGYTRAILSAHPQAKVIAFDRDPTTKTRADEVKKEFGERFTFIQDCFSNMSKHIHEPADGLVLDIGVSSMQIDEPERGFSLRFDGPLDMRMSGTGPTAAEIIRSVSEKQLADILFKYGEEKCSRRIAHALKEKMPETTLQMVETIHAVMPRPKDGSDSATRSFQALRIFVNDELGELEQALKSSISLLKAQGRLVVVSFHSLEDRIVKDFLNNYSIKSGHVNKYAIAQEEQGLFKILTKKPVTADEQELENNPRAHSAKLRAAIRTEQSV